MKFQRNTYIKEKFKRTKSPEPVPVQSIISHVLVSKGLTEIQNKINHLWENWELTLGTYLSSIALPLGHKGKTLLIAGEDNIVLNELTYAKEEILERVHGFLDEVYFEKIELHLLFSQRALNTFFQIQQEPVKMALIRPDNLGNLLHSLPEGKVRTAYIHYLSLFQDKS